MRISCKQLDMKLGQSTQEELDSVLRKIKIEKQQGLIKYPLKYRRPGNWTTYCFDPVMHNRQMNKGMHPPLPKRDDLALAKN